MFPSMSSCLLPTAYCLLPTDLLMGETNGFAPGSTSLEIGGDGCEGRRIDEGGEPAARDAVRAEPSTARHRGQAGRAAVSAAKQEDAADPGRGTIAQLRSGRSRRTKARRRRHPPDFAAPRRHPANQY